MEMEKESTQIGCSITDNEYNELLRTLEEKQTVLYELIKYESFWCPKKFFRPVISSRKYFKANDTDIMLATMSKSGTTWLKALTFSIVNRKVYTVDRSPLLISNPHKLVPTLEIQVYMEHENPDLQHIPFPRIFSTHMPFKVLPQSILESNCKIIHICRNPLDMFISLYHFLIENMDEKAAVPTELDKAFDMFCQGIHPYGPFWELMLGYWNARQESPKKVLFLRYEDLQEDAGFYVRKIADFLDCPFSEGKEKQGLVEQISSLCSFEKLNNLDANKSGVTGTVKNTSFFRKGKVGDWKNYLTPQMAQRMKEILKEKFIGTGLVVKI